MKQTVLSSTKLLGSQFGPGTSQEENLQPGLLQSAHKHQRHSMKNARSHHIYEIDTDHRLVTAIIFGRNDLERWKKKPERRKTEVKVLMELRQNKAALWEKLSKTRKETSNIFLKQKNRINVPTDMHKAHIMTEELMSEATETMRAKDNAQAALAKKALFKSSARSARFGATVEKLTDHFDKRFNASIPETQRKIGHTLLVSLKKVASRVNKLKNNKAPVPDAAKNEDLTNFDRSVIQKTLNGYIKKATYWQKVS